MILITFFIFSIIYLSTYKVVHHAWLPAASCRASGPMPGSSRALRMRLVERVCHMHQSAAVSTGSPMAARTRHLLEAPITPTLLRLATPNVIVMMAQAAVSTCEVYFVAWL